MLYLNLSEIDKLLSLSFFWSKSPCALARFKRADFHGNPDLELAEAVKNTVEQALGWRPKGEVFVLANLRYFGFNMNPLTTYYCFDESGKKVEAILAEVNNTPWNERRAYVLKCQDGSPRQCITFDKDFTVSPFSTLNMQYRWRSTMPGEVLYLHIDSMQTGNKVTDATLRLKREVLSKASMHWILVRYPFMTVKVFAAIYWQALRLFVKGVPFLGKNKVSTQKAELDSYEIH